MGHSQRQRKELPPKLVLAWYSWASEWPSQEARWFLSPPYVPHCATPDPGYPEISRCLEGRRSHARIDCARHAVRSLETAAQRQFRETPSASQTGNDERDESWFSSNFRTGSRTRGVSAVSSSGMAGVKRFFDRWVRGEGCGEELTSACNV